MIILQQLLLFLFIRQYFCIRPHYIGPPFSIERYQTLRDNLELAEICGRQDHHSKTREFPWAISVMIDGKNHLGGSIISPYHILTVAHGFLLMSSQQTTPCIVQRYRNESELPQRHIAYGGRCIRGKTQVNENDIRCEHADMKINRIRSVMVDPHFALYGCADGHDWAIIEVEHKLEWTNKTRPICLPSPNENIQRVLTVAGWGRSYIFKESGPFIRETPMYLDEKCKRPWSDHLPNKANDYLCATSMNTLNYFAPRTCHGDSGSGMEQIDHNGRAQLIALTSFGTHGCPANELARFTRIHHYLDDICELTGVCYRSTRLPDPHRFTSGSGSGSGTLRKPENFRHKHKDFIDRSAVQNHINHDFQKHNNVLHTKEHTVHSSSLHVTTQLPVVSLSSPLSTHSHLVTSKFSPTTETPRTISTVMHNTPLSENAPLKAHFHVSRVYSTIEHHVTAPSFPLNTGYSRDQTSKFDLTTYFPVTTSNFPVTPHFLTTRSPHNIDHSLITSEASQTTVAHNSHTVAHNSNTVPHNLPTVVHNSHTVVHNSHTLPSTFSPTTGLPSITNSHTVPDSSPTVVHNSPTVPSTFPPATDLPSITNSHTVPHNSNTVAHNSPTVPHNSPTVVHNSPAVAPAFFPATDSPPNTHVSMKLSQPTDISMISSHLHLLTTETPEILSEFPPNADHSVFSSKFSQSPEPSVIPVQPLHNTHFHVGTAHFPLPTLLHAPKFSQISEEFEVDATPIVLNTADSHQTGIPSDSQHPVITVNFPLIRHPSIVAPNLPSLARVPEFTTVTPLTTRERVPDLTSVLPLTTTEAVPEVIPEIQLTTRELVHEFTTVIPLTTHHTIISPNAEHSRVFPVISSDALLTAPFSSNVPPIARVPVIAPILPLINGHAVATSETVLTQTFPETKTEVLLHTGEHSPNS